MILHIYIYIYTCNRERHILAAFWLHYGIFSVMSHMQCFVGECADCVLAGLISNGCCFQVWLAHLETDTLCMTWKSTADRRYMDTGEIGCIRNINHAGFFMEFYKSLSLSSYFSIKIKGHWLNIVHSPKKFTNTSACWITRNKHLLEWSQHRKYCMYTLQMWHNE